MQITGRATPWLWALAFMVVAGLAAIPGIVSDDESATTIGGNGTRASLSLDRAAVRGALVTATIEHLERVAGRRVELTVATNGPVPIDGGDARIAYLPVAVVRVTERGEAVSTFRVPNALSGEDDIVALIPGRRYRLEVATLGPTARHVGRVEFRIAPAQIHRGYRVEARRGPVECGAPPLEIDFDGSVWTPDDLSVFPSSRERFPGTFVLVSADSAHLRRNHRRAVTFSRRSTGYSC